MHFTVLVQYFTQRMYCTKERKKVWIILEISISNSNSRFCHTNFFWIFYWIFLNFLTKVFIFGKILLPGKHWKILDQNRKKCLEIRAKIIIMPNENTFYLYIQYLLILDTLEYGRWWTIFWDFKNPISKPKWEKLATNLSSVDASWQY